MTLFDIPGLSEAITAFTSAAVTYLFTKPKQKQEVKSSELDNVEKAIEIWRKIAQDLTKQVNEMKAEILQLEKKVEELTIKLSDKKSS